MYELLRPLLFLLPPETAHRVTLKMLRTVHSFRLNQLLFGTPLHAPRTVMGLKFPNPVGLAAGLDKNGQYISSLATLGFGFIEVGTVTPKAQLGNPLPRLFRLPQARALINRMGFNNQGVDKLIKNILDQEYPCLLGINIGKNFKTPLEEAVLDYLTCFNKVYSHADYVTINISSPNTPGLRQLQQGDELDQLLMPLKKLQHQLADQHNKYVPLVVKIAPDLTVEEIKQFANKLIDHAIDGVIATNTTIAREGVAALRYAEEAGGLSGEPLLSQSTQVVKQLATQLHGKIPIIAAGGIMNAVDAQLKLHAGASLVQVYTGLIYQGPTLVRELVQSFSEQ